MGLLATIVCVLTTAGPCESPPAPEPLPVTQFAISYERSGGFAALPRKLVIRPGQRGTATTFDPKNGRRSVEFRVAEKKVKQLRAAAEAAHLGEVPPSEPGSCADCYVYSVAYRGASVSIAQVDVPTRMRGLIDRAEALIAAHLPFH